MRNVEINGKYFEDLLTLFFEQDGVYGKVESFRGGWEVSF